MPRLNLLLLALVPLALSQTIQTTVSCLSDGQCFTDRGEDAVCGKLDASASASLPVVEGFGEEYIIRIDLSAPLPDDPNPPKEQQCIGKECPTNISSECAAAKGECKGAPNEIFTANDPRNPTLGGVGCETPAFRKACQKCCVQTDLLSRVSLFESDPAPRKHKDDKCASELEKRCGEQKLGDEEAFRASISSNGQNCIERNPLGFYRTPRPRFFQRCTQLAGNLCGNGLRLCRDFS